MGPRLENRKPPFYDGGVEQTQGSYSGVEMCAVSLGPDQEEGEEGSVLSSPHTPVPQDRPKDQRQLEHSLANVTETAGGGGVIVASPGLAQLICIPRRVWQK